jgi:two-component system sensor histidine kinase MtrB
MSPASVVTAPFRAVAGAWRGSLMLRVTATTLVLSVITMAILGFSLLSRITTGLLASKERTSVGEATAGMVEAQRLLDAADTGPTTPSASRLVDSVITTLAARVGAPGQFDVLLLSSQDDVEAPERGTNLVSEASVPMALRQAIASSKRQSWTYSTIVFLDGRTTPGLVVGAPLDVPTVAGYELYYIFPLTQEQQTLDLVRGAVVLTGTLLIGLLVLIAGFVTRQVVSPVRAAARTASRLAQGALSERMKVRGQDDLARLAASFNEMAASLQRKIKELQSLSSVQQRFVSDVSHELRTPLSTVRMAADKMFDDRGSFDPQTARAAELLQTQLDRFEALLVDLLEISRFDAGAIVLESDSFDLNELVSRIASDSSDLAERRGTSIRVHPTQGPVLVAADAKRIDRVLRNLVGNAIEHGNELGIDIRVGANSQAVAVTVRDFGVGLRPGESALVFNRFWRADPARARTIGGTGLGLAISLQEVRLHDGWLEAWGEPGRGACFRMTLPLSPRGAFEVSPLPLLPQEDEDSAADGGRAGSGVASDEAGPDEAGPGSSVGGRSRLESGIATGMPWGDSAGVIGRP